jgi:hypothetical protein
MTAAVSFFSITTPGFINRGNLIIEQAARRVLGLAENLFIIDAHRPLDDRTVAAINRTDLGILPGATLIEPGDHPSMARIGDIQVPILALGVAFNMRGGSPDTRVAAALRLPVGSRDPFTHRALEERGIPSRLVGCQTLLLGAARRWQQRSGPVVASLGLGGDAPQVACIRAIAEDHPVTVLSHAPGYQDDVIPLPQVRTVPLDSLDGAFDLIRSASLLVTGRIHGVLSCLALGTPVVFMSAWSDSRYDLLRFLGVPVEPPEPERIRRRCREILAGALPAPEPLARAEELRQGMRAYLQEVATPLGLAPPALRPGWTPVLD